MTTEKRSRPSHQPPVFHLHVPKNAGTSLLWYLQRLDGPGRLTTFYEKRQTLAHLDAAFSAPGAFDSHYSTHLPASDIWARLPGARAGPFMWVTTIRPPVQRVLSWYRYVVARGYWPPADGPLRGDNSLRTFVSSVLSENPQCRYFHPAGTAEAALAAMDAHGVVAAPSDHVTMLMDGVYAGRGLQPLAPIHRNRTDPVLTRDALTPEIEEMLAQRLGEDAKLSDAILARTQMAGRAVGDPIPTLRVQDDLATLVPAGQSVILFGAGMTTPRLIAWLRLKGVAVVAVLTTSGGGRVSEVPVLAIDEARGRFPETVGLIAAQAYAPAVRALTAAGCESIVDALDFTEALPDPAWTNMAPE